MIARGRSARRVKKGKVKFKFKPKGKGRWPQRRERAGGR